MPIKVQNDLPARAILESENIFVMDENRAMSQDIRPLQILILNLMPIKEDTETQLLRALSNTPLQVDCTFLMLSTHVSKNTSASHLNKFYVTFDEIRRRKFDGMIITGAPVEQMEFEEVDYWEELLDGASQLEDGTTQLASGVLALLDGANTLNNGAAALDEGLGQLTNGLDTLSSNNSALNSGAQQVADGVLASANKTLKEGGLIDADMTWDNYAAVIDNILTMNDKTLAAGRRKMVRTIWEQAPSFKDSQLDLALYLSATKTNHDLEAALHLMQNYDPSMLCGLVQLLTSQEAKDTAKAELKYQVENSQDIADVRALKDSLSKIQYFVSSVGQYTAGVQTAADGAHSAKDGSAQLAAGTKTLYDGVNTLNEGASQLNDGTHQLNDGLNQFNEEGISKLTGALDQDQLHGLKTVLDEMSDRLENYTSFAGAPEDAESSVKFVYKTAETVAAADNVVAETETVKEGNIFTRLWQRIVDLFKF